MPLSHDEVVHGKATIVQKMNGDYDGKFPQARAMYMYMFAHPGKKLNFMGNEIGQLREWDEKREQDWNMLEYPVHKNFAEFVKDLCNIYLEMPALWAKDHDRDGFEWIDCHQENKCIYVFERRNDNQRIVALFNFSDVEWEYELNVKECESLELILNSNDVKYAGESAGASNSGEKNSKVKKIASQYRSRKEIARAQSLLVKVSHL